MGEIVWEFIGPEGEARSIRHEPRMTCVDFLALRDAAVAGLGVALLPDLSDAAIEVIIRAVRELPSPECEVFIAHVGGAMARVAADATAWSNRSAHFIMNAHTRWRDKDQDSICIAWARRLYEAAAPFAAGSVYVNFMPDDESDRVEHAYGANYRRLAEIKRRYDPDNRFRMNQNIMPSPEQPRV